MICIGCQNWDGMFVNSDNSEWDVLSRVAKMVWDVLSWDILSIQIEQCVGNQCWS